ncbi:MAG: type II toxin-antitoxin system VapC family toxin [Burkholderiales bacterium]|nr:type II toxin-antitoxin system VapC family toxin [Burkholderiales bacterium]
MTGFVLDASVAVAWCFEDEATTQARALLDRLRDAPGHVPGLWALEIGNILLGAEKRGRISQAGVAAFLGILGDLDIRVDADAPGRAFRDVLPLARARSLTTYDAAYLELALRLGVPLATKDKALAGAAAALDVRTLAA